MPVAVEQRADERRHDGEREHREDEEQRDVILRLAGLRGDEQRASEADHDGGVAGVGEGVHLDEAPEATLPRALGVARPAGGAQRRLRGTRAQAVGAACCTPAHDSGTAQAFGASAVGRCPDAFAPLLSLVPFVHRARLSRPRRATDR